MKENPKTDRQIAEEIADKHLKKYSEQMEWSFRKGDVAPWVVNAVKEALNRTLEKNT